MTGLDTKKNSRPRSPVTRNKKAPGVLILNTDRPKGDLFVEIEIKSTKIYVPSVPSSFAAMQQVWDHQRKCFRCPLLKVNESFFLLWSVSNDSLHSIGSFLPNKLCDQCSAFHRILLAKGFPIVERAPLVGLIQDILELKSQ